MIGFKGYEREEKVGRGSEKEVYEHPNDPAKVVAEFRYAESPKRLRGRFYLTKILHELFPDNLPDISVAATNPHVVIMERKQLDEAHKSLQKFNIKGDFVGNFSARYKEFEDKIGEDRKFKQLKRELAELGIGLETAAMNFGYDDKNNLVYVDSSFDPWPCYYHVDDKFERSYDPAKLRNAVNLLEPDRKKRALKYLERLEILAEEEKAELPQNQNNS
jgi:hypothetical protein